MPGASSTNVNMGGSLSFDPHSGQLVFDNRLMLLSGILGFKVFTKLTAD